MIRDAQAIENAVKFLITEIQGSDKIEKDMLRTPKRVSKSFSELFEGYDIDIPSLFTVSDGEGQDQIVAVKDIHSWSTCMHHLLPFEVTAHIAYLPDKCVIGVSKIERLVQAYSRRLQIQERITRQVADALMTNLKPKGVAVILQGTHLCMRARGVRSHESKVVSSVMLGAFRDEPAARAEVLALLGLK